MGARQIEDSELLALTKEHGWNAYAIAKAINMEHSPVARRLRRLRPHQQFPELPSITPKGERFLITCAVSGCEAIPAPLPTIRKYCEITGTQFLVVPLRYRNPTSQLEEPYDWFDPVLIKHFCHGRHALAKHLVLMGDVPTQPTRSRPLSDVATFTGANSAIFPHPKVALTSTPTGPGQHAKLLMTTSAITQPIYSQSGAGKKGEFHHVAGAVLVELDAGRFHMRHIHFDSDGAFHDLGLKWTARGATKSRAEVLTLGDLHAVRKDPGAFEAAMEMASLLQPEYLVLHDVLDFESASHHNTFIQQFGLHQQGRGNVEEEIRKTGAVIEEITRRAPKSKVVIVESNHHAHLTRWLNDKHAAHDCENALLYHWLKTAVLAASARGEYLNPFEYAIRKACPKLKRVHFLAPDESLRISEVEYGYHGDKGPNGSRGSIASFAKVAVKVVIGHSHTPGIMDGACQVGTTSSLDLGYNVGSPSSWMHSNCVQYKGGKRALLNIISGHWRRA